MGGDWMGGSRTGYNTDTPEFLLSALADADTLAQRVTDTVIGVLRNPSLWHRLVEANKALR